MPSAADILQPERIVRRDLVPESCQLAIRVLAATPAARPTKGLVWLRRPRIRFGRKYRIEGPLLERPQRSKLSGRSELQTHDRDVRRGRGELDGTTKASDCRI